MTPPSDAVPIDSIDLVVDDLAGFGEMRGRVEAALVDHGVDHDVGNDVLLAISELVTNGFLHASAGVVDVGVRIAADRVEVRVEHDDAIGPPSPWHRPGPTERGGRGLLIVDAVGDTVRVIRRDGRRTTVVVFRLAAPVAHATPA